MAEANKITRLIFTGDVMLGRLINQNLIASKDYPSLWGDTEKIFSGADLTFINLECALTRQANQGEKETPVFFFKSDPQNVKALTCVGVDYACLANNHILDFGERGLDETIETLKKNKIAFSGAGKNLKMAQKPAVIKINKILIKVFAFSDNEPVWEAGKEKPGIFYLPIDLTDLRVKDFLKTIRQAKSRGGVVIVSAHWGPNMVRVPLPHHRQFARALIEAGCDLFHGHSAHVFQGVEIYPRTQAGCGVIFYDCGEMIDDYAIDPILRNDESFIFEVDLKKGQIQKVILHPILIENLQVNLAQGKHTERICEKMLDLCQDLGTSKSPKDRNPGPKDSDKWSDAIWYNEISIQNFQ